MREAQPNPSHYALSAINSLGLISGLTTQNVDGLDLRAQSQPSDNILELHGSLLRVVCLSQSCGPPSSQLVEGHVY